MHPLFSLTIPIVVKDTFNDLNWLKKKKKHALVSNKKMVIATIWLIYSVLN